ncbi:MAG: ATP-binding protein [Candidatus Binatia bacterium]
MNATPDLRELIHAILTCVTAGPGLGFNRAVLFLADDRNTQLVAVMAIGPATAEEAHVTWSSLAGENHSLEELLQTAPEERGTGGFQALVEGLTIPLDEPVAGATPQTALRSAPAGPPPVNPLLEAYRSRRVVKIVEPAQLGDIPPRLREVFSGTEVVCVPLLAKERQLGVIVADNAFSGEPIGDQRIQLLQVLALLAALALDNVGMYQQLDRQARQLQQALDDLKATQEQLLHNERLATVGAVVARVSHEIRNPLSTIGGFARTVKAHPEDRDRAARNAGIIVEEVENLEALLKEMLDFTNPKSPALQSTDLTALITTMASVHRDEFGRHGVVLRLELESNLPAVLADRNQIQRALLNLWQNARHAMEEQPADASRTLTVQGRHEGGVVRVACSDTGGGIPRDILRHIFTPFFTTKPKGTGLGLAVVKRIVDAHGGSIEVQSTLGAGTTFVMTLPLAR